MSKRQRTVSSSGEGPTDKRHKPSDEDQPADVQTTTPKVSLGSSQVDVSVQFYQIIADATMPNDWLEALCHAQWDDQVR
jgi:hypothetical protein